MRTSQLFSPQPASVRLVRSFVREAIAARTDDPEVLDAAVLLASELATNVVDHARTPFTVEVTVEEAAARFEVSDGSSVAPAVRDLLDGDERGRGLRILDALATEWGVSSSDSGKAVWFSISLAPRRS